MLAKLLKVVYGVVALKGLFAAVAPRLSLKLDLKWLSLSLKNVGDLEPREWYVTAVRATGVGMLAAGGVGLLLTGDDESEDETGEAETDEADEDTTVEPIDISPETVSDEDEDESGETAA